MSHTPGDSNTLSDGKESREPLLSLQLVGVISGQADGEMQAGGSWVRVFGFLQVHYLVSFGFFQ